MAVAQPPRKVFKHPGRVAITVGGLLLAANILVLAVVGADTSDQSGRVVPSAITRVGPGPGALRKPQEGVFVDLRPDLQGVLVIDGHEIPNDQVIHETASSLGFQPGPGKDIERFDAGTHAVRVIYWKQTQTRDNAQEFTWTFRTAA